MMKAIYTSVFDDSVFCTSACDYDPNTKTVTNIDDADNGDNPEVLDANSLTDEYVTVNGEDLREEDGVTFVY